MDTKLNYIISLKDQFRKTMKDAGEETKKVDGYMGKLEKTIGSAGKALATYFAFSKLKDFTFGVVMATAAMQSFQNSIIASSRTEGEGRANIAFLNTQVNRLGLNLLAAQDGYKTFTGAVMGSNLQGEKSNKIFRQVSEATTVLGLSGEQTEGAFLALGQMISKGTVQAEELRGQLAERIPGAFQIGARAMGMTTKQLGDAMKDGLIDSSTFLVKFGNELEKTFGGKLGNATHSLQANINRMVSEWERLKVNLGNSQTGIINGTISWASAMLKSFNEVMSGLNRMDMAFKATGKDIDYAMMEKFNNWLFMGSTSGFANAFTGGKGKMDMLERSLQSSFVTPSTRSKTDALGSQAGLLRMMSGFGKSFANKEISKLEYQRSMALMEAALTQIKGNLTITGNATPTGSAIGKGTEIGSPVEVSGARPQNINIHVDKLGDVVFENVSVSSDMNVNDFIKKAVMEVRKEWMELLNDSNQMANR